MHWPAIYFRFSGLFLWQGKFRSLWSWDNANDLAIGHSTSVSHYWYGSWMCQWRRRWKMHMCSVLQDSNPLQRLDAVVFDKAAFAHCQCSVEFGVASSQGLSTAWLRGGEGKGWGRPPWDLVLTLFICAYWVIDGGTVFFTEGASADLITSMLQILITIWYQTNFTKVPK